MVAGGGTGQPGNSGVRDDMHRVWSLRWFVSLCVFAVAGAASATADPVASSDRVNLPGQVDPISLYGDEILFDVLRNGEPIGNYLVRFKRNGGELQVESRASIEVEMLFVSAYRLRHQALETWRDGVFTALNASTNKDGDFSHVEAVREGQSLEVTSVDGAWDADGNVLPATHWNMAQMDAPVLIHTISGKQTHVSVLDAGIESVAMGDLMRPARRFIYSGDEDMETWYDDAGRWVKLRFLAKDGSTIEYVCRKCSAPTRVTAAE
jgi:hypothetical protein